MSTKRVAVRKELKTNFDQILRLTVTSLRLVGIPLDPFGIKPKLFRYVHLALLTCIVPNWKDVLTVFRQIDELNLFGPDDYKKFRKIFLNGIIISITAVFFSSI